MLSRYKTKVERISNFKNKNLRIPMHPLGLPPLTPQPSPKIGAEPGAEKGPFNFLPLLHLSYISSGSKVAFPGI